MEEKTINYQELVDVVRRMKRKDELFYFFLRSCESGNLQLCQLCLDAGADINIYEHWYKQPLLLVLIDNGKFTTKVADWLIEKGAEINIGSGRYTSLSLACSKGDFNIAKYFIDKGIKIHQYKEDKEISDLYCAVNGGNYEIVKLLVELGVDLEADVRYEANPFVRAVEMRKSNIVELFLKKGVIPNLYCYGRTPLHIAVKNKDLETAQLLLKYNANVNAQLQCGNWIEDYLSVTPMDMAVFMKDTDMQKLLRDFDGGVSSKEEKLKAITEYCNSEKISSMIKKVLAS